jgi:predicted PurR-regulated permease PerM
LKCVERRTIQQAWFLILLGVVSMAFLWLTLDFIEPVFWAAVLAIIFNPAQRQLDHFLRGRKTQAALIGTVAILVMVFLPLVLIGVAVSQEALNLYNRIQDGSVDVQGLVTRFDPILRDMTARFGIDFASLQQRVYAAAGALAQLIATRAVVVGQNVLSVVAQTALMLYLLFFILRDGDKMLAVLGDAIPMGDGRQRTLFNRFASVTRATLKGTVLVGLVQGALGGLLFWVLGLNAPAFWGVIMAMLSLLPLVGPALVWGPTAIFLIATGAVTKGIILLVGGAVVVGTADNILRPLLVGRETRMPDYMVLLSTLGGLSVFGPAGFVAGPVLAALFMSVWDMFAQEQRGVVLAGKTSPPPEEEL